MQIHLLDIPTTISLYCSPADSPLLPQPRWILFSPLWSKKQSKNIYLRSNYLKPRWGAPLRCSGLRIWCWHCSVLGRCCGVCGFKPGQGTSAWPGHSQKTKSIVTMVSDTQKMQTFKQKQKFFFSNIISTISPKSLFWKSKDWILIFFSFGILAKCIHPELRDIGKFQGITF